MCLDVCIYEGVPKQNEGRKRVGWGGGLLRTGVYPWDLADNQGNAIILKPFPSLKMIITEVQ